jgi:Reverse transcriptase (RNA-dependent DNA polymerase)
MSIDKDFLLDALLRHNYLPTQRKAREELPPCFSTELFTPLVAKELDKISIRKGDISGYDQCEYKLTRFDNASRRLSLPHPLAHAKLSICIYEQWEHLEYITSNQNSVIKPQNHADGRIIVMDYEAIVPKSIRLLKQSFGKRFRAHADISNFFPSIYSHALPWALVGFDSAKKNKPPKHSKEWFNQIDEKLRLTKRNETQGIAIGPATSNVVTEIILARIDEKLSAKYSFVRFIDDYTCDCTSETDAQDFIRELSHELAFFKLSLNNKKTKIRKLPDSMSDEWVLELATKSPQGEEVNSFQAVQYLDYAVALSVKHPEGSILKFAFKSIANKKLTFMAKHDVLRFGLILSFHHPVLLPLLEALLVDTWFFSQFDAARYLNPIVLDNARLSRSDGMCWGLYLLAKFEVAIEEDVATSVIATKDAFSILMLYWSRKHTDKVKAFCDSLDLNDLYTLDCYWILLYQLYFDGVIDDPYKDGVFEVLKKNQVTFLDVLKSKPYSLELFGMIT